MLEKILFVDDEPKILQAYQRTLRKQFDVVTACSGQEALEKMEQEGPYPVVVSDMQMPEMNGVQLLAKIKAMYPNTMNIMLTGNADQQTAVEAIGVGVFRFLNKPCPPDKMTETLNEALKTFEARKSELALLESTVKGSINALVEVLSISNPKIFGRATTIRRHVVACAKALNIAVNWELESTALLSQIGVVTLPEEIIERVLAGLPLSEEDQATYDKHPELAAELVNRIPRLEVISEAIRCQHLPYKNVVTDKKILSGDKLPIAARLLKPILDFVAFETASLSTQEAVARLQTQEEQYDPKILTAVIETITAKTQMQIKEIPVSRLTEKMRIASDVLTQSGVMLVAKGQEVGPSLIAKLANFRKNNEIDENVFVYLDDDKMDPAENVSMSA